MADGVNLGNAYGEIRLDGSQARNEANAVGGSIDKMSQGIGASLGVASAAIAGIGVAMAGVGVGLGAAVSKAASFEQSMANVGAVSNATDQQLEQLTETAKQMGATTSFTAKEAADGLGFLAMAGFSVQQQIDALPGTLALAAAGNMDLADTADIASNVLTGMGLAASDMDRVADVMAKTITTSNTDIRQLGDAMKYVAPQAAAMGFSVEETAAAIGKLSDAGLQASMAGTGLRGVMQALSNPTKEAESAMLDLGVSVFNLDGTMKSLPDIIEEFQKATAGMTDQQRQSALGSIFQTRSLNSFQVLLSDTGKDLHEYTAILEDSGGTAERIADKQLDTLQGQMKLLGSAIDAVAIEVGEVLLPILTDLVRDVLIPFVQVHGPKVAAALRWIVEQSKMLFEAIEPLQRVFGVLVEQFSAASVEGGALRGMFDGLMASLQPLVTLMSVFSDEVGDALGMIMGGDVEGGFMALLKALDNLRIGIMDWALSMLPDLIATLGKWSIAFLDWVADFTPRLLRQLVDTTGRIINLIIKHSPAIIAALSEWSVALVEWARDAIPPLLQQLAQLANTIVQWITQHAPAIAQQIVSWARAFYGWLIPATFELVGQLGQLLARVLEWIGTNAVPIVNKLGTWLRAFADWAIPATFELLGKLGEMLGAVLEWIIDVAPDVVAQLAEWADAFVHWIIDTIPVMGRELGKLLEAMLQWIAENGPGILKQLGDWAVQFVQWVIDVVPKLIWELGVLFGYLLEWLIDQAPVLYDTIVNHWVPGMVDWVANEAVPGIMSALGTLWDNIVAWFAEHGPIIADRVMDFGVAIVNGIKDGVLSAWDGFTSWMSAKVDDFFSAIDPRNWFGDGGGDEKPPEPERSTTANTTPGEGAIRPGEAPPAVVVRRASGGPVASGQYAVVGEQGQELVRFGQAGMVYPNSKLEEILGMANSVVPDSAMGGSTTDIGGLNISMPITVNASGGGDPQQIKAAVVQAAEQATSAIWDQFSRGLDDLFAQGVIVR